jgi:hypothetical protein
LIAGDCITIGGTSTAPVVGLTPTGISAGTYDGFEVNDCGLIVSYMPPTVAGIVVAGTAPITVGYNGGTMTYTVSVGAATETDLGVVTLVDAGDASTTANHNLIPGDSVVTWDGLLAAALALGW